MIRLSLQNRLNQPGDVSVQGWEVPARVEPIQVTVNESSNLPSQVVVPVYDGEVSVDLAGSIRRHGRSLSGLLAAPNRWK